MNVLIISASHRNPSQSRKVADVVSGLVKKHSGFKDIALLDLAEAGIPLWDEGVWRGEEQWMKILAPLRNQVRKADAYIIVVPEWNGGATPSIKNFALFFGEKETGHKPVWLISVSSEINGQYPVTDMRSYVYKNNKWVFIPDHTIVRFVHEKFNEESLSAEEKLLLERMQYSLRQLELYARAMREVRDKLKFDDRFKYAM